MFFVILININFLGENVHPIVPYTRLPLDHQKEVTVSVRPENDVREVVMRKRKRDEGVEEVQQVASKRWESEKEAPLHLRNREQYYGNVNIQHIRSIDDLNESQMTDIVQQLINGQHLAKHNPKIKKTNSLTTAIKLIGNRQLTDELLNTLLSKRNRGERKRWLFQKLLFANSVSLMTPFTFNKMITNAGKENEIEFAKEILYKACAMKLDNSFVYSNFIYTARKAGRLDMVREAFERALAKKQANSAVMKNVRQSIESSDSSPQQKDLSLLYVDAMYKRGDLEKAERLFHEYQLMPKMTADGCIDLKSYSSGVAKLALKCFAKSQECPEHVTLILGQKRQPILLPREELIDLAEQLIRSA